MKTYLLAAIAALSLIATSAVAGSLGDVRAEPRPVLTETDRGIDLSFKTTGRAADEFRDNWAFRGGFDVVEYRLGVGMSVVSVYGEFGAVAANEYGTLGVEYNWATALSNTVDLDVTGDVAYVMLNDFDDGVFVVTPSAKLSLAANNRVDVFSEVGYSWDATNDWASAGGYAEVGLDVQVTDTVSFVPSVVRPFDTANNDAIASVEFELNF